MAGGSEESVGFGAFVLDLGTGELLRDGVKVKLQDQPFAVLALLLEEPGQLVTREEFRERIWGAETYVDFDQGLNKAIKNVRAALGDSAEHPVYVETLPKRGYRFIAPLRTGQQVEAKKPEITSIAPRRIPYTKIALVAGALAAGFGLLLFLNRHNGTPQPEVRLRQLTKNSAENFIQGTAVSPDGQFLLIGDQVGVHLQVIATGEVHTIRRPTELSNEDSWYPTAWFPDQTHFLAISQRSTSLGTVIASWKVSILGDGAVRLRTNACPQSVSPDGSLIAFVNCDGDAQQIWVTGPNGEDARAVSKAQNLKQVAGVIWSPDGRHLFNLTTQWVGGEFGHLDGIESRDLSGGPATSIASRASREDETWPTFGALALLPDGRVIYSQRGSDRSSPLEDSNLWERKVNLETGKPLEPARRLTNWFGHDYMAMMSASRDGKTLVLQRSYSPYHAYLGELGEPGHLQPLRRMTLDDSNESPFGWTPDSKAVLLLSSRTGTMRLFKYFIDEMRAEPVNTGAGSIHEARVSPDRQWIVYTVAAASGRPARLMKTGISDGVPQLLKEVRGDPDVVCPFAPATSCFIDEITGSDVSSTIVISSVDPITGHMHELFRSPDWGSAWTVSSNGAIALVREDAKGSRIQMLSQSGKVDREINLAPWSNIGGIDWSIDPRIMYTASIGSSGATILRGNVSGKIEPLWHLKGSRAGWAIPSQDGRHVAVLGTLSYVNDWLVENL